MFSIENMCKKLSDKVCRELNFDDEKKLIINYGFFAIIQMVISIFLVIIFGSLFDVLIEALIISFITSILRKSSGGMHASTPEKCNAIGTVFSVGMAMSCKMVDGGLWISLIGGVIVFICSGYIIFKLAPVDSKSKPIISIEKRKRLRNQSLFILIIYAFVVVINISIYLISDIRNYLVYTLCIYVGLLWQVFSLTQIGHRIMGKLDHLLP